MEIIYRRLQISFFLSRHGRHNGDNTLHHISIKNQHINTYRNFIPCGTRLAQEYPDKCFLHDANMLAQQGNGSRYMHSGPQGKAGPCVQREPTVGVLIVIVIERVIRARHTTHDTHTTHTTHTPLHTTDTPQTHHSTHHSTHHRHTHTHNTHHTQHTPQTQHTPHTTTHTQRTTCTSRLRSQRGDICLIPNPTVSGRTWQVVNPGRLNDGVTRSQ